jgi:FOG: CheY-like receiver
MNPLIPSLLLAEDDETDILLFRRALKEADVPNPLHVVRDGREVVDFLTRPLPPEDDRLPALLVLDLQMPRLNGFEVLSWLRAQPVLSTIPAFVFSSSGNHDDIERAHACGANAFIVKPPSLAERMEIARLVGQWLKFTRPPLAAAEGLSSARREHHRRRYGHAPDGTPPGIP